MSRITRFRRTKYDEPIGNLNTYFAYRTKRPPPPLDNVMDLLTLVPVEMVPNPMEF